MPTFEAKDFPGARQAQVLVPGPCGDIEALTTYPATGNPRAVAIICHPDPQAEGTMHNKVVTTCAKVFDRLGYASVRFNYRGVGKSAGQYGEVDGEIADALAVRDWVLRRLASTPIVWLGFSFGSYIAAYCVSKHKCQHLISIAPPVSRFCFDELNEIDCRWDIIQGDKDQVVDPQDVIDWHQKHPNKQRRHLEVMHGAEHFFHGRLIDLRELLTGLF
jgi:alpha/beta superfamily hydrolase